MNSNAQAYNSILAQMRPRRAQEKQGKQEEASSQAYKSILACMRPQREQEEEGKQKEASSQAYKSILACMRPQSAQEMEEARTEARTEECGGKRGEAKEGHCLEDAPPGHVAHERVRYNGSHKNPYVKFIFEGTPFQTTVAACGSRHAAEVIARACYLKFEQGWSKEQVLKFRAECYAHSRQEGPQGRQVERKPKQTKEPRRRTIQAATDSQKAAAVTKRLAAWTSGCSSNHTQIGWEGPRRVHPRP